MELTVETIGVGGAVIAPEGRLTIGDGDLALRTAVRTLLDEERTAVIVDLEGVTYMDSAGLGELADTRLRVLAAGGTFAVRNASLWVRRLLRVAGLDELLGVPQAITPSAGRG